MILRRGITSFFNWDHRGTIPDFPFADFKRIVYSTAASLKIEVTDFAARNVTPNFHSALLNRSTEPFSILGHSTYSLFAFVEPLSKTSRHLSFIDRDDVASEIRRLYPDVLVVEAQELTRRLEEHDLSLLDEVELEQIRYWKPETVGDVAFNWWD